MPLPTVDSLAGGSLLLAWQLKDKNVLLVGGGDVAASRIENILIADARITLIVLDALSNVLRVGEMDRDAEDEWSLNEYALLLEEAGGLEAVHKLLEHDNVDVFNLAYHIMSTYFAELDDDF